MSQLKIDFSVVDEFEQVIAEFFGAPYAVMTDSCTHGVELCLRYTKAGSINCPKHTYLSIPFLASKLGIQLFWRDEDWKEYYRLTHNVIDAAVLWREGSYVPYTYMCVSFQYQKHLSLGRGGCILVPDKESYDYLKKMSYDGRLPNIPWRDQNIKIQGYHYYMTPEVAKLGLLKFDEARESEPRKWSIQDWPDLTQMDVFR